MAAPKGTYPPGGSRKGIPNRITADLRAMIVAALDRAGGEDYLVQQAHDNPRAFMSLVARLIPAQVTGKNDRPLFPELSTQELEQKFVAKLMAAGIPEEQARVVLDMR